MTYRRLTCSVRPMATRPLLLRCAWLQTELQNLNRLCSRRADLIMHHTLDFDSVHFGYVRLVVVADSPMQVITLFHSNIYCKSVQ